MLCLGHGLGLGGNLHAANHGSDDRAVLAFAHVRALLSLNVSCCDKLTDAGMLELITQCPTLVDVDICYCGLLTAVGTTVVLLLFGHPPHAVLRPCFRVRLVAPRLLFLFFFSFFSFFFFFFDFITNFEGLSSNYAWGLAMVRHTPTLVALGGILTAKMVHLSSEF
jgi:hypothetical protein